MCILLFCVCLGPVSNIYISLCMYRATTWVGGEGERGRWRAKGRWRGKKWKSGGDFAGCKKRHANSEQNKLTQTKTN